LEELADSAARRARRRLRALRRSSRTRDSLRLPEHWLTERVNCRKHVSIGLNPPCVRLFGTSWPSSHRTRFGHPRGPSNIALLTPQRSGTDRGPGPLVGALRNAIFALGFAFTFCGGGRLPKPAGRSTAVMVVDLSGSPVRRVPSSLRSLHRPVPVTEGSVTRNINKTGVRFWTDCCGATPKRNSFVNSRRAVHAAVARIPNGKALRCFRRR